MANRMRNGWRVREVRERLGLSRESLAGNAGCSLATVVLMERGKHTPNLGTARKLAAALGVSVDELFPPQPATLVDPGKVA